MPWSLCATKVLSRAICSCLDRRTFKVSVYLVHLRSNSTNDQVTKQHQGRCHLWSASRKYTRNHLDYRWSCIYYHVFSDSIYKYWLFANAARLRDDNSCTQNPFLYTVFHTSCWIWFNDDPINPRSCETDQRIGYKKHYYRIHRSRYYYCTNIVQNRDRG